MEQKEERGLTYDEIAAATGQNNNTVYRYFNGYVKKPDLAVMATFAHLFGMSVQDLIIDDIRPSEDDHQNEKKAATVSVLLETIA